MLSLGQEYLNECVWVPVSLLFCFHPPFLCWTLLCPAVSTLTSAFPVSVPCEYKHISISKNGGEAKGASCRGQTFHTYFPALLFLQPGGWSRGATTHTHMHTHAWLLCLCFPGAVKGCPETIVVFPKTNTSWRSRLRGQAQYIPSEVHGEGKSGC